MPDKLLLLLNFALAAYLTGVIWTVQLVHYPGFALVSAEAFRAYHQAHLGRMGWVVMAPMVAELLAAAWWAWAARSAASWWSLGLVAFVWAVTFFVSVPLHNRLATTHGPETQLAVYALVRTNWLRTLAWSARLGLLGWVLVRT
ncbi:hypothetical protein [Hymenobacter latericus]|uniref:hypothetical protein n=1 Tax=Hymenobacter sp. YIM 151858-1 TaxID=2987688 RepID=UPI0022274D96|nr:hypothetical protein [Hymenobacter sp. YIM 151858-1]UYZ58588.1 hypothetical protein OIS50_16190 [Hymenobacter sp. YIM 151858-1]